VTENHTLTIGTDRPQYELEGYGIECCTLINSVIIELTPSDRLIFKDLDKLVCKNLSAMLEKNCSQAYCILT
jgi:hypothetical protein